MTDFSQIRGDILKRLLNDAAFLDRFLQDPDGVLAEFPALDRFDGRYLKDNIEDWESLTAVAERFGIPVPERPNAPPPDTFIEKPPRLQMALHLREDPAFFALFQKDPAAALAAYPDLEEVDAEYIQERITDAASLQAVINRFSTTRQSVATLAKGLEDSAKELPLRYRNIGFASQATPTELIDSVNTPLPAAQPHYLWLQIGDLMAEGLAQEGIALPTDKLPPEARLTIALFSVEGEIALIGAETGEIQLAPRGDILVTRRADEPTGVPEDILNQRLYFAVRTMNEEAYGRLRCNIYFQNTLVQALSIVARVAVAPTQQDYRMMWYTSDYTLSNTLDSEQLVTMGENILSIMVNTDGKGSHGFSFIGKEEFKHNTTLSEGEIFQLLGWTRGALRKATWGDDEPYDGNKRYQYGNQLNLEKLRSDLISMAINGWRAYAGLVSRLAGSVPASFKLQDLMVKPGQVQIATNELARLVVPAAMLYDYPLLEGNDSDDYSLCPQFLEDLKGDKLLEECACFQGNCPSYDDELVICPSGFWGFRHYLGLPLSVKGTPDAPLRINGNHPSSMAVSVWKGSDFKERPSHEQRLQQMGIGWEYADSKDASLKMLKATESQVVYFYCHGGLTDKGVPYLQLGDIGDDWFTRGNLRARRIHWDKIRPLVFINCISGIQLSPERFLDFVSGFVGYSGAAGVIGTEIAIPESLAVDFAEEFFLRFMVIRETVGAAMRGARLRLLKGGNPLGLVYISFALPSLKLNDTTVHSVLSVLSDEDKLSLSVISALCWAEGLRQATNAPEIYTEYLLIGLYQKSKGPTHRLLTLFDDSTVLSAKLQTLANKTTSTNVAPEEVSPASSNVLRSLTLSDNVKKAIIAAESLANKNNSRIIRSRHLLAGILSVPKSVAAQWIGDELQVEPERIYELIVDTSDANPPLNAVRQASNHRGSILGRHTDNINALAINANGDFIVSASDDQTIKVWNIETGEERFTMSGHAAHVYGCGISSDGSVIVSSSQDRTIKVWDGHTGQEIFSLAGHTLPINCCTVSADGSVIVSGADDNVAKVWDGNTGQERFTLRHEDWVNGCAVSDSGQIIITCSSDKLVKVWNGETGEELFSLSGHSASVSSCAVSRDGRIIVSGSRDNTLNIWNGETGDKLLTLLGHKDYVRACDISPDGRYVVSASNDRTVRVWSATTGRELLVLAGHTDYVTACAIAILGRKQLLITGSYDQTVRVWKLDDLEHLETSYLTREEALARVEFVKGNLLDLQVDALINSTSLEVTNTGRVGQQMMQSQSSKYREMLGSQPPMKLGDALVTEVQSLPARYIIHVPTEEVVNGATPETITQGVTAALNQAATLEDVRSIALPSIGTGLLSFEASTIATHVLEGIVNRLEKGSQLERVVFAFVDDSHYQAYVEAYKSMGGIIAPEQLSYRTLIRATPNQITVGQSVRLAVELIAVPPDSSTVEESSEELIRIPPDAGDIHCFITAEGLRVKGSEAVTIRQNPQTGQPIPANFELQGHLQGRQPYSVEFFVDDPQTGQRRIFQAGGQITVKAPQSGEVIEPILPPLNIRMAPQPALVLQVQADWTDGTNSLILTYYFTSRLPGARYVKEPVGQVTLSQTNLNHIWGMVYQTVNQTHQAQPEDVERRLLSLGMWLYDRLFPDESAVNFRRIYWEIVAARKTNKYVQEYSPLTLLVIEDVVKNGLNWLPWELVAPYQDEGDLSVSLWGEHFQISRWADGLGPTLFGEFPLGELALIPYKDAVLKEEEQQAQLLAWQELLQATGQDRIAGVIKPETEFYGLHILRHANETMTQRELAVRDGRQLRSDQTPEEEARGGTRLDLKLKRPVVTFSTICQTDYTLSGGTMPPKLTEQVLPFLRAGASVVVGTWWPTSEAADRIYWHTFYDLIERRVRLGEAVWRARLAVRDALPQRIDWLSYTLFGDPRAKAYWPEESQGYTSLECLNPETDGSLLVGKTYTFCASISKYPPIQFQDRLVKPTTLPKIINVLFTAPDLIIDFSNPVMMHSTDGSKTTFEATVKLTIPSTPGNYPLIVQLYDEDDEELKALKLILDCRLSIYKGDR